MKTSQLLNTRAEAYTQKRRETFQRKTKETDRQTEREREREREREKRL